MGKGIGRVEMLRRLTLPQRADGVSLLLAETARIVDLLEALHRAIRFLSAGHAVDHGTEVGLQLHSLLGVLLELLQRLVYGRLVPRLGQSSVDEHSEKLLVTV